MGMFGTSRIKPFQVRPPAGTTGSAAPPAQGPLPFGQTSNMSGPVGQANVPPVTGPVMGPVQQTQYAPVQNGMGGSQTPAGREWASQVANSNGVVTGNGQANAVDQARANMPQQPPVDMNDPRNAALIGYRNA